MLTKVPGGLGESSERAHHSTTPHATNVLRDDGTRTAVAAAQFLREALLRHDSLNRDHKRLPTRVRADISLRSRQYLSAQHARLAARPGIRQSVSRRWQYCATPASPTSAQPMKPASASGLTITTSSLSVEAGQAQTGWPFAASLRSGACSFECCTSARFRMFGLLPQIMVGEWPPCRRAAGAPTRWACSVARSASCG